MFYYICYIKKIAKMWEKISSRKKKPLNILNQNRKFSCIRKKILNVYNTYQRFFLSFSLQHKELEYSYDFWFEGGQHITDSSSREVIFNETFTYMYMYIYRCCLYFISNFLSQRWKLYLQHIKSKEKSRLHTEQERIGFKCYMYVHLF